MTSADAGDEPPADEQNHRDSPTGLHVHLGLPAGTFRIARSARGPLDPPARTGNPDASWSRYDVPGRTVYLAQTAEGAYAEVLAYTKRRLGRRDPLVDDAAAVGLPVGEFVELIGAEWAERQHMDIGHLSVSWRVERLLYRVTLPTPGWWVDIEHPDSIAAAEAALEAELAALGVPAMTVGMLRGDDRRITTLVARWVHDAVLGDGTSPIGITYGSKHGTGRCWAYWLPEDSAPQPRPAGDEGTPLADDDPSMRRVAERFRIRLW